MPASRQFQFTAARRRLPCSTPIIFAFNIVSIHSRPKAAAIRCVQEVRNLIVSIHSRPKAAAPAPLPGTTRFLRFNSQPPEGGCPVAANGRKSGSGFNSQPPEGGCPPNYSARFSTNSFQFTAARRRLLSASKPAKNQSNTTTFSLTCSDSRECGKYSAHFSRHTSL